MSDLTKEEQTNVRTALRFLRTRSGDWKSLAKVLRVGDDRLPRVVAGTFPVTPTLAFRVAKLAGVGFDDLLAGEYPAPGTCPYCGHRPDEAETGAGDRGSALPAVGGRTR